MRRAVGIGAAGVALVAIVAYFVFGALSDDGGECFYGARDFGGEFTVLTGEPDEAFQSFLTTAPDEYRLPSDDVDEWESHASRQGFVRWQLDGVTAWMYPETTIAGGWIVASIEYECA